MTRVQIPAYTDHWMKGDRFGDLVSVRERWDHYPGKDGVIPVERTMRKIASVKLDKSGETVRVFLDDCEVL